MSAAVHMAQWRGSFEAVVVAASLGGLPALTQLLEGLPAEFPAPVVVVQHGAGAAYAELLARRSPLEVSLVAAGGDIPARGVAIVPPGLGLVIAEDGVWARFEAAEATSRPADAVLGCLASRLGPALIAVVLSGKLDDGARGVRAVKQAGGRVLVQDPVTASAPGMPTAALATGCVDFVLSPTRLAVALVALAMAPGGAALLAVPAPSWAAY